MSCYAGIGSRQTPEKFCKIMTKFATCMERIGYILRSGGADGADKAFELGVRHISNMEIYLPWRGFNKNYSHLYLKEDFDIETSVVAKMAAEYHPCWDRLKDGAKRMMIRNCFQIVGKDLCEPVEFVVCWTKDGKASGGTGQAIRIANDKGIKVYNLFHETDYEELKDFYRRLK